MSELTPEDLEALDDESDQRAACHAAPESVDLPVRILNQAQARAFKFQEHEVVALAVQAFNMASSETEPYLLFIAPEDAGPLGRLLISVASPLKPVNKKGSK